MNPWLETIFVIAVALSGVLIGWLFSRLKDPYWMIGYFLAAAIIAVLVLIRVNNTLRFSWPISWIMATRVRFIVLSLAATIGLTTPLSRLGRRFERVALRFAMVVVVLWFCILPFLVPAIINKGLANLKTQFDINGICYQTTDYTCAPAAAVTALRQLGLDAQEGELAVLAHSTPITGTLPGCLNSALMKRYGDDGIKSRYRHYDSIEQLKNSPVTLAMVRDRPLSDHCVAVLEVSDSKVTIGDPVFGKMVMTYKQFKDIWRYSGISITRDLNEHI